jgi:hypothetical protein
MNPIEKLRTMMCMKISFRLFPHIEYILGPRCTMTNLERSEIENLEEKITQCKILHAQIMVRLIELASWKSGIDHPPEYGAYWQENPDRKYLKRDHDINMK